MDKVHKQQELIDSLLPYSNQEWIKRRNEFLQTSFVELIVSFRNYICSTRAEMERLLPPNIRIYKYDSDTKEVPYLMNFIQYLFSNVFVVDIHKQLDISKINLDPNVVYMEFQQDNIFDIPPGSYFLPLSIFQQIFASLSEDMKPDFQNNIYRAGSQSQERFHKGSPLYGKFYPQSITLFNQDNDHQNQAIDNGTPLSNVGLEYLEAIKKELRKAVYITGTVAHEVGHHIYACLFKENPKLLDEWKNIIQQCGSISMYSKKYNVLEYNYDEELAEAIRLYSFSPNCLNTKVIAFIKKNLTSLFYTDQELGIFIDNLP